MCSPGGGNSFKVTFAIKSRTHGGQNDPAAAGAAGLGQKRRKIPVSLPSRRADALAGSGSAARRRALRGGGRVGAFAHHGETSSLSEASSSRTAADFPHSQRFRAVL